MGEDIKIILRYDEDGYYNGECIFQILEGVFPPKRTTEVALPNDADLEKYFYRFDGEKWEAEKKPASAEELVGIVVSHKSQTSHDQEMRVLVQKYGSADGYRIKRGDELQWIVEKIPQEELDAKAIDVELSDFDQQISSLKDRMATAMLQGDQETVASLQAEYQTLMGA